MSSRILDTLLLATHIATATALVFILPILWRNRQEPIVGYMILFKGALVLHNLLVVAALILAGPLVIEDSLIMILLISAQTILSFGSLLFAGYLVGVVNDAPIKWIKIGKDVERGNQ